MIARAVTEVLPRLWPAMVVAYLAVLYWQLAGFPFVSDDLGHLAMAAQWSGPADAFDPALVPLRPLQHLWFWAASRFASDAPWLARAPVFVLHGIAILMTVRLAVALGLPAQWRWAVAGLAAVVPNIVSITWVAAVGWPLRQVFVLLAVTSFIRWRRHRGMVSFGLAMAGLVGGLASHQSAFLVPAVCLAWVCFVEPRQVSAGTVRAGWLRSCLDPLLIAMGAIVVVYVVYVGMLRAERHHGVQQNGVVLANAARALWSVFPSLIREFVVDSLRASGGAFWLGAVASLLWIGALMLICVRSRIGRFLVVWGAVDLGLTAVSVSGFHARYSYTATALCACGLGLWTWRGSGTARLVVAVVGCGMECGHGGSGVRIPQRGSHLGQAARRHRRDADRRAVAEPMILVDIPAGLGREDVVPAWRWGLHEALAHWGIAQPWALWRTDPTHSTAWAS